VREAGPGARGLDLDFANTLRFDFLAHAGIAV
jgi:hypothetical protein